MECVFDCRHHSPLDDKSRVHLCQGWNERACGHALDKPAHASLHANQRMMTPPRRRCCHMDILGVTLNYLTHIVHAPFHTISWKGAITTKEHSYQKEVHNEVLHHNNSIVENLSPGLSPPQRENRKQKINQSLYEVFKKYQDDKVWRFFFVGYLLSWLVARFLLRKGCWKYVCHLHETIYL